MSLLMFWIKLKKAGKAALGQGQQWGTTLLALSGLLLGLMMCPAIAIASPLQSGIEAFNQQDYPAAMQHFNQAIQQQDELDLAYGNRCLVYLLMDAPQQATEDCTTALKLNPTHPLGRFYRGLARYRLTQYEGAIADFTRHLQQQPQDARTYYNRGLAFFAQGATEQAITDYQQALAYAVPLNATPLNSMEMSNLYNDLGVAYLVNAQLEQAIVALDQAIALDNQDPRAYFNRGCVCHRQGNYAAALKEFERVLALDAHYAETYLNRGIVKQQMGDLTGAIADLETAIAHFQAQGDVNGVYRAKLRLHQLDQSQVAIG